MLRVMLAPLTAADVAAIVTGGREPSWADDYPTPGDIEVATWLSDGSGPMPAAGSPWGPRKVVCLEDGLAIGGVGFHSTPDSDGVVEIGYGISPSHRGQGAATSAVAGIVAIAREQGATGIVAGTDADNPASQRVLQRNGFVRIGMEADEVRWSLALTPESGA